MRATQKWSGETSSGQWRSAEISLEHSDLLRLLRELGLGTDDSKYKTADLYQLLDIEVDRLLSVKVLQLGMGQAVEVRSFVSGLNARRDKLVEKMKAACE